MWSVGRAFVDEDVDEIRAAIAENATGAKDVTIDGFSTSQHSLQDQIAADRYLRERDAQQSGGLGMKLFKLVPPGIS